jgi:hypothetical protein
MSTMKLSQVIARLESLRDEHGDVPMVLYDLDTSLYFPLEHECFEAQRMDDGSVRVSVGAPDSGYGGETLPGPAKRPL